MKRKSKPEPRRVEQAGVPPQETIAGRLIPLWEVGGRAFARARGQSEGERKSSAGLPVWVDNVMDRLFKTIFKSTVALDPKGQFVARDFGRMLGVLLRLVVFVLKEADPLLRKAGLLDLTKEQDKRIERASGIELLFPIVSQTLRSARESGGLIPVITGLGFLPIGFWPSLPRATWGHGNSNWIEWATAEAGAEPDRGGQGNRAKPGLD